MNLKLRDKTALVTGGSHGIGLAIKNLLEEEGCTVYSISRREGFDVLDEIDMNKALKKFRNIDILVNNVGGGGRWGNKIWHTTTSSCWQGVYEKNAGAAVKFTMNCLPYMIKKKWGRVITIASILGKEGGGRPWFNMAKAAEISLMKTLAMNPHYARMKITFNSIAPGAIMIPDTGWAKMREENPEEFEKFTESLPLGRLGTPEEVANLVVFLCSDKASLISGACIAIDGGESKSF